MQKMQRAMLVLWMHLTLDLSPSRAFSTSGNTDSPHHPVSRSFLCFLPRHYHHIQVVFNYSSPLLPWSVSFFTFSSFWLDERVGCIPFCLRGPATLTLTDFFSRFPAFCPFQFFASLRHLWSLVSSWFLIFFSTAFDAAASNVLLFVTVMVHVSLTFFRVVNTSDSYDLLFTFTSAYCFSKHCTVVQT